MLPPLLRPRRPCPLQGWAVLQARPRDFLVAALISFLVNLFCYLAIKYVSATSFKVAGGRACAVAGARCAPERRIHVVRCFGSHPSSVPPYSHTAVRLEAECSGHLHGRLSRLAWSALRMRCCTSSRCVGCVLPFLPACLAATWRTPCRLPQERDGCVGRHSARGRGHAARAAGKLLRSMPVHAADTHTP